MKGPHIADRRTLSRRTFLRGAGVAMALPLLESMAPVFARARQPETPRRMFAVCNNLGLLPDRFFPKNSGRNYELSPYLAELEAYRDDFTILSGVSHPGVDGSHSSDVSFLTCAPHPGGGGFRNSISIDQFIAGKIGHLTRFPSLSLGVNASLGRRSLSWTDAGVLIPCENRASSVYRKLFLQGSKEEIERQVRKLQLGESIMDTLAQESKALTRRLNSTDRDRLDQYTTAVREAEQRLAMARAWERKPKPTAPVGMPSDPSNRNAFMQMTRLMYQMAQLAFQTDSTRCITLLLDGNNSPAIKIAGTKITDGYHNLSHHGMNPEKLAQLDAIDRAQMKLFGELIRGLKGIEETDGNLLKNTVVMYGSNFGDANKHTTTNMPVLIAGGRLKHGQHLAFDRTNNYPLPNLFISMMQSMGLRTEKFATSTGPMQGLHPA
ncbi:MAG: DUF1552 domain-containing protein [Verrucomicrobiota bacterium]|jgi:hypothetical protein|nr:DUF1552 domain-containing protein [Verrucomicrobiota bacterium]MDP7047945.1 DUF1552 domain-containing protein [Verrucomicrobiota bacterium]